MIGRYARLIVKSLKRGSFIGAVRQRPFFDRNVETLCNRVWNRDVFLFHLGLARLFFYSFDHN